MDRDMMQIPGWEALTYATGTDDCATGCGWWIVPGVLIGAAVWAWVLTCAS